MDILKLDELRQALKSSKLDVGNLQRIWKWRVRIGWVPEVDIARGFAKCAMNKGELLLASESAKAGLEVHKGDLKLRHILANALAQMGSQGKAREILEGMVAEGETDSETLSLLGRTYKDDWQAKKDAKALELAFESYRRAFETPSNDPTYPGINAATIAVLRGDMETARRIAAEVLRLCQAKTGDDYWNQATLAEALAVLGRTEEARAAYLKAAPLAGDNFRGLQGTRRQARMLSKVLLHRNDGYDDCFPEVKLVIFSGHMIDEAGRRPARFPAGREAEVKAAIAARLEKMKARIGFCSAARGSEILFLEAMLERGGAIHIMLPWKREQFVETCVRVPDDPHDRWPARFNAVLEQAATVNELGELYKPTSSVGHEYCDLVMNGRAQIMAKWLDLDLKPLALWDGEAGEPGDTGAFVNYWRRQGLKVNVIQLPNVASSEPPKDELEPTPTVSAPSDVHEEWVLAATRQEIRAMLFADIVGYSKLPEEKIPKFVGHFMRSISRLIADSPDAPIYANTWGDAFYFVFSRVDQAGRFALEFRDRVLKTDWSKFGLVWEENGRTRPLGIRTGLHAGPVYTNYDPVVRQLNFTGAHVSRAARIEPVTAPGRVFASEEFAALAAAENARGFTCEFIGTVGLAKNYGNSRLYDLRRT